MSKPAVDVAKLRELLREAPNSSGVWSWDDRDDQIVADSPETGRRIVAFGEPTHEGNHGISVDRADAELVCAAVNALPMLLEVYEAALHWRHGMVKLADGRYVDADDGSAEPHMMRRPSRDVLIDVIDKAGGR